MNDSTRVLVVDDDAQMRSAMVRLLTDAGYEVKEASTGKGCLRLAKEQEPDLILLDVVLPDIDGVEICQRIKAEPVSANSFVVLISGLKISSDSQAEGLEAGADGYIVRPISNRELLARVQAFMRIKQAGDALRENEERYRAVVEDMPALICRFLPDGVLTYVNKHYCRYFNKTCEELVSNDFFQFIPDEEREGVRARYASLTPENPVVTYEHKVLAPDGTLRWQRWTDRALFDERGRPVEYQSIGEDVTEQRRADDALRESESRLRTAIESIPFDLFVIGNDGRYVMQNSTCRERWGELIGLRPEDAGTDEETLALWQSNNRRAFAGEAIEGEVALGPRGEQGCYYNIVSPIRDGDQIRGILGVNIDITDRKRAEQALAETNQLLETIFAHTHMLVAYLDPEFNLIRVNRAYAKADEREPSFFTGKNHFDLYPNAENEAIFRRVVETGEPYFAYAKPFEYSEHPERGMSYWDWSLVPIKNAEGTVTGLVLTLVDITERVRAQEALRRSEERYATAQRVANIGSWDWDIRTGDLLWSDQIEPMFGFRCGEFGATYEAFLDCVHREDRAPVGDAVNACIEEGDEYAIDHRIVWPDGTVRWVSETGDVIRDENGEAVRMLGVVQDITERKQAEEELRKLSRAVEQSPSTVVITDTEGKIEYVNPKFTEITGYTAAEAVGENPRILKSGKQSLAFYEELWSRISAGQEWRGEFVNRKKNGELYWELASISPVRNAEGEITHFIKVAEDISERVRAENQLQEAKEAAEAARREEQERRREAERRRRIAESLADVLAVLNSNQSLDEVLDYIAVQAGRFLDNQAVAIYSLGGEAGALAIQAAQGLPIGYIAGADIPIGHAALRKAVTQREPVTVPNVATTLADDADLAVDAYRGALVEYWAEIYRALLAVPIIVKDDVYGGILLYFAEPRQFSDEEIELAVVFANQAALAIENARLRDQVRQAAATAERSRLARDLHDAVTQTLFSASLIAEALPRVWERDPEEGRRGLEELRHLTRGASAEMRTMLLELRPAALTEKPLGELLRHLTEAVTGRTRVPVRLTVQGDSSLPPQVQIAMYRIAQEALNNVAKHAGASEAAVDLHCLPGQVALSVRDDGTGFDPSDVRPDQLGVGIMRERAESVGAALQVTGKPGHGTQVVVIWQSSKRRQLDD